MGNITESETPKFLEDLVKGDKDARNEILLGKVALDELIIPSTAKTSTSYSKIAVSDNLLRGELVELNNYGFNSKPDYYASESKDNPIYGHVFKGATPEVVLLKALAERLADINDTLRKMHGIEFEPMNGFRPLEVQQGIFKDFYNAGVTKYQNNFSDDELHKKATEHALTYASKPPEIVSLEDSTTWYAHGTGAAIDLLLREKDGARLDFGVIFDWPDEITGTNVFEDNLQNNFNNEEIKINRRKLFWSMATAGFVNYPEEFFHFDPFKVEERISQFAILNAESWGFSGTTALRATVPVAKEAINS